MRPTLAALVLAAVPPVAAATPTEEPELDGALTLVVQRGPDYLGARRYGQSLRPGFYLRWGRLSVSSGGGWASPRQDDELRGLGIELARTQELRISLGLRMDSGRDESSSPTLAGMGDVKRTIRARIGASWRLAPEWELRAGWTIDAFARGGGNLGEAKIQRDWAFAPGWQLSSGVTVALGGDRYLQTYYGVTPEQSQRSGHAVFSPRMGLRDLTLFASVRRELDEDWVALAGLGFTRMLGDASRSPLTQRREAWTATAGIGRRF